MPSRKHHSNAKAIKALSIVNKLSEEYRKKHPSVSPQEAHKEAGKIYRAKYKKK